jgi:hypothetical protein
VAQAITLKKLDAKTSPTNNSTNKVVTTVLGVLGIKKK